MSEKDNSNDNGFNVMSERLEAALSGSSEDPIADGTLKEFSSKEFMTDIRKAKTAVVEFYRTHCPYCQSLTPILEELASDYKSKVLFAKVNIDDVESARERFDILGVPLVVAFKKGHPVGRLEGLRTTDDYDEWIDSIHKGLRPMGIEPGPTTKVS
ncbi:MAG: thioredoxin family protein [Candidatus Thorarchaeota archaeon]|jgi:thioredoxin 1